MKLYTDIGN